MASNSGRTVTLKDLAAAAGTSLQTVSQILNKDRADLFRPETVAKVREAARRLGYRPNRLARSMRSGRSNCIALLLDWNGYRSHNPPQLVSSLLRVLEDRRQHLILSRIHEERPEDAERAPDILREILADGLLVNYHLDVADMERVVAASSLPAVWINARREHDAVIPDDHRSGRELTEHLIARGHRHILYCDTSYTVQATPQRHFSKVERHAGYAEAMTAAGLRPELVESQPQYPLAAWLGDRPEVTALVTYGAGRVDSRDLELPDGREITLATFGEGALEVGKRVMPTMITDWPALCEAMVAMLDRLIDGAGPQPLERIPSRLVTGDEDQGSLEPMRWSNRI